jgi:hypothetical protein
LAKGPVAPSTSKTAERMPSVRAIGDEFMRRA